MWVEIEGSPSLSFSYGPTIPVEPAGLFIPRGLQSVGDIRTGIQLGSLPELANATIQLKSLDLSYFSTPWFGRKIKVQELIRGAVTTIYQGIITGISVSNTVSLTTQAGQWTDPVPVRKTTDWGFFTEIQDIPIPYGRVTARPLQYDRQGSIFVLGDGALAGVNKVTLASDGSNVPFEFENATDDAGKAVGTIRINPVGKDTIVADYNGRLGSSGLFLERPGPILEDFIAYCGLPLPAGSLDTLRAQGADLLIGGLINTGGSSQAAIQEIMDSIVAVFSPAMLNFTSLWPLDTGAPWYTLTDINSRAAPVSVADRGDMFNTLRMAYDYDYSLGQNRRAIDLKAPNSLGTRPLLWDAKWLHSPRIAESVGSRLLKWKARVPWTSKLSTRYVPDLGPGRPLQPGATVAITRKGTMLPSNQILKTVTLSSEQGSISVTVEGRVEAEPRIDTIRHAVMHDPIAPEGITFTREADKLVITVRTASGTPLAGATVTLDRSNAVRTNTSGQAAFTTPVGPHNVLVEKAPLQPQQLTIDG